MAFSIIVFIISIILYLFRPVVYSQSYCITLLVVFVISTVWFVKRTSHGNYFNFHSLFFLSYFFTSFVYPVFIYPYNVDYLSFYGYNFQEGIITEATALALLGSSSYVLGGVFMMQKKIRIKAVNSKTASYEIYIPILKRLSVLFFVLFLFFVGRSFFLGIFNSASTTSNYFLIAFQTLISLTVILICYSKRCQYSGTIKDFLFKFKIPFFVFIFLFLAFFFFQGNRGPALQLLLIIISAYSLYIKKIKFKVFLIGCLLGMCVMTFISSARVTRTSGYTGDNAFTGYFSRGFENFEFDSFYDIAGELIGANRNLFYYVDYTNRNGVNYGRTMLSPILSVVPGLGAYSIALFDLDKDKLTAGKLISSMILGEDSTWGIGGSLIGDIYMSFGTIGIIFFMLLFGFINHRFQLFAFFSNNIFYLIAYLISISYSVYYPRASYLIAFRLIVWPILILIILRYFKPGKTRDYKMRSLNFK